MNIPGNSRGDQPQTQPGQCRSVLWWVTAGLVALLMAGAIVLMGMPQDQ